MPIEYVLFTDITFFFFVKHILRIMLLQLQTQYIPNTHR